MRYTLLPCFLLLTLWALVSCTDKPNGGQDPGGKKAAAWSVAAPLVQKVEVSADGTVLETYEYTYDDLNRILSLKKTNRLRDQTLLNLQYTYRDDQGMRATGKFYPVSSNRYISATLDADGHQVSYTGSWADAGAFVTSFDTGGTATGTVSDTEYAAKEGHYSYRSHYGESYTVSGGCITASELGTTVESQTSQRTGASASSSLTVRYSYSDHADGQNFAVYLFPCDFPVWVAAGLPGCKKLVTGITMASGSVPSPVSTRIDYTFNPDGSIDTATRTDCNDSEPVLVRTYKFHYQ